MLQTQKNRLIRLETYRSSQRRGYDLQVTILAPDTATDDDLAAMRAKHPERRYIRETDFLNECC